MARLVPLVVVALAMLALADGARSTTLSVAVPSVAARSNSAAVSWRASARVSAVVEYGPNGEYGAWTRPTAPSSSGRILLPALEPGTAYQFRVVGLGADGARAEAAGSFTTRGIGRGSAASTNPNALVVDGQPLFPRMLFHSCFWYYGSAIASGVNVFMGSGCTQGAKQLELVDGRAFSILAAGQRRTNGRGLIGWYQQDEPDGHGLTRLPTLPSSAQSRRVTFLTLTDHFSSRSAALPIGKAIYPKLIAKAEMIGFDSYPMQVRCSRDFTLVYDLQRELVTLARGKPTYQWIEAGPMGRCSRSLDPTGATIQVQVWLAIAGGARGIGYFPDFWPPDIAGAITSTNREIAALAPALLAPEVPISFGPDGTPVKAGARQLNGAYYVIAANPAFTSATATFTVPGLNSPFVRVYGENRTLPVQNGRFTDSFGGLGVHLYVAAPPGM